MYALVREQNKIGRRGSTNLSRLGATTRAGTLKAVSPIGRQVRPRLDLRRQIGDRAVLSLSQKSVEGRQADCNATAGACFAHELRRTRTDERAPAKPQPRLKINTPGDLYEREADRVAEQVMRMPDPRLQRACPCGGGCPECDEEKSRQGRQSLQAKDVETGDTGETGHESLQAKGVDTVGTAETGHESLRAKRAETSYTEDAGDARALPVVQEVLRSPGRPLDLAVRAFMEPRFGHDFSRVRVHADAKAAESAREVNALAYTLGRDVVFGGGRYVPGTSAGQKLLAHELTHVIQQSPVASSAVVNSTGPKTCCRDDGREAEAMSKDIASANTSAILPVPTVSIQGSAPMLRRFGDLTKVPLQFPCDIAPSPAPPATEKIVFENRASSLTGMQKALLENCVINWNALGGNMDVRVDGFASRPGSDELNWQLSCERAYAVETELMNPSSGLTLGIPASFITMFAQGETDEFGPEAENRCATIFLSGVPAPPTPVPPSPPVQPPPTEELPGGQHICGPDVTVPLVAVLAEVRATFAGWSTTQKREACDTVDITLAAIPIPFVRSGFIMAWDIEDLYLPNTLWLRAPPYGPPRCGVPGAAGTDVEDPATCSNSVQVLDKCFLAGTVNYALFGQICRLCNTEFGVLNEDRMESLIRWWKILTWIDFDDPGPPIAWARAGFRGFPGHIPAQGNRAHCTGRCPVPFYGPSFTWVWEPHHPR